MGGLYTFEAATFEATAGSHYGIFIDQQTRPSSVDPHSVAVWYVARVQRDGNSIGSLDLGMELIRAGEPLGVTQLLREQVPIRLQQLQNRITSQGASLDITIVSPSTTTIQ
ncbi:hypothetical protein HYV86_01360 [Candidatus Woesearchaeota archaeon]|nr:hypothetical protein [Candidatus Woesearchaeota archaeon]